MSGKQHFIVLSATIATVAWAAACGDGATEPPAPPPDPPRPTTVTVTPATAELTALGETVQLQAEVRDQNGNVMAGAAVTWSSGDGAVATVNSTGLVTGAGNGTATITATAGAVSGSATVMVAQEVSAVAVTPAADTVVVGDTLRLAAEAADANRHALAGVEFEWEVSDTLVAAVDDAGLVTGVGAGEAEVTATAAGVTGRAALTVVAPAPTAIAVTPDTVALTALGQTVQLAAEVHDQIGRVMEGVPVSWSSADTLVAAVDSAGLVTAIGGGATTVAATAGEVSGAAVVSVMQSAGSVVVSPATDTVAPGDTLRLAAEAFDENGHRVDEAEFTWSSSDVSVATVDGTGLVAGVAEGRATITAAAGDASGASDITVENPDRAALAAFYEATGGVHWRVSDNWLTDAPLDEWYGVRTDSRGRVEGLRLVENSLTGAIPPELGRLSRLRVLTLWGNQIEEISGLAGSISLETLSISQNNITDLSPLAGLTNLTLLSVGHGPISDLSPLSGLTKLRKLQVFGTDNPDLSLLSGLSNLRELTLSHGNISDISALAQLTGLTRLWLWDNQVENISALVGLTDLTGLSLGKNNIPDISPLAGLTNLTTLFLNDNNITDVSPLSGLIDLTFLNLASNNITDISPLAGLTNLQQLDLSANNITDISPLAGLTNLEELDLRGNPYETLPTGDFDIELVLLDEFTESEKNVLQYVARRWMAIVTEDLLDYEFNQSWSGRCGSETVEVSAGDQIDDLRVYVKKERLSVGTLGFAGPMVVREATHLPVLGCMGVDLSHANLLITGLHEIGHVLGIGSLWTDYFQDPPNGDQHFNGPLAIAAFDAAGGQNYAGAKVPVEGGHWRGSVFGDELMTPTGTGAISAITVQSLADLGYGVDINQADAYTLPSARATTMDGVVPTSAADDRASGRLASPSQAKPKQRPRR